MSPVEIEFAVVTDEGVKIEKKIIEYQARPITDFNLSSVSFLEGYSITEIIPEALESAFMSLVKAFTSIHDIQRIASQLNRPILLDMVFVGNQNESISIKSVLQIVDLMTSHFTSNEAAVQSFASVATNAFFVTDDFQQKWNIFWSMFQKIYQEFNVFNFVPHIIAPSSSLCILFNQDPKASVNVATIFTSSRILEKFLMYILRGKELANDPNILKKREKFLKNRRELILLYNYFQNGFNFGSFSAAAWNHFKTFSLTGTFPNVDKIYDNYIPYSNVGYDGIIFRALGPIAYYAYNSTKAKSDIKALVPKIFAEMIDCEYDIADHLVSLNLKPQELIDPIIVPLLLEYIKPILYRIFSIFWLDPIQNMLEDIVTPEMYKRFEEEKNNAGPKPPLPQFKFIRTSHGDVRSNLSGGGI